MRERHEQLPDDLAEVVVRLRAERVEATPLELDRVKQRVLATRRRPVGGLRRARLTTAVMAIGLVGTTGVAFAASGGPVDGAGDRPAASSQYCPPPVPGTGGNDVRGYGAAKCGVVR